jgi:hypothetical protein
MKYLKVFFVVILMSLFFNCARQYQYPKYENSNQIFIENTIKKLDIGKELDFSTLKKSKVILRSLETNQTLDYPLIAMIEDNLIRSLINNRFMVLERDENAVKDMIEESQNTRFSLLLQGDKGAGRYYMEGTSGKGSRIIELKEESMPLLETRLSSADYMISYRILECGLNYEELKDDKAHIKRNCLVRLSVRVQRTSTGEIKYADTFEAKNSDIIEKNFVDPLSSFHYAFFSHKYPLQRETIKEKAELVEPEVETTAGGGVVVLFLGIFAAGITTLILLF